MLAKSELAYLSEHLSFWENLSKTEQAEIGSCAFMTTYPKGQVFYSGNKECLGLVLLESGQLRAFISSKEGKEISLYRLLSLDICILSTSCLIKNLNFNISFEIEKESKVYVIPTVCFHKISESNAAVKNLSLELISARFSEVMWVFDQYVFGSAAQRLAGFLLEHAQLEASDTLNITHEFIANDLGTAREVVTRLLKHFATDGLVSLSRGAIRIESYEKLNELSA